MIEKYKTIETTKAKILTLNNTWQRLTTGTLVSGNPYLFPYSYEYKTGYYGDLLKNRETIFCKHQGVNNDYSTDAIIEVCFNNFNLQKYEYSMIWNNTTSKWNLDLNGCPFSLILPDFGTITTGSNGCILFNDDPQIEALILNFTSIGGGVFEVDLDNERNFSKKYTNQGTIINFTLSIPTPGVDILKIRLGEVLSLDAADDLVFWFKSATTNSSLYVLQGK